MEELIRQCQQGDRVAMGQLYTAMHDELLTQCRKYATDDDTAHDLLHDAFLLIFCNIGCTRWSRTYVYYTYNTDRLARWYPSMK